MRKILIYEITTCDKIKHLVRHVEKPDSILTYFSKAEKIGVKWINLLDEKEKRPLILRMDNITSIKLVAEV